MKRQNKVLASLMLMTVMVLGIGCNKKQELIEEEAEVETSQVTEITSSTAKAGGMVISDGNSLVVERGVCWSDRTDHSPTIADYHVSAGAGLGSFNCELTGLEANTTYWVRAYAFNNVGVSYGSMVEFKTKVDNGGGGGDVPVTPDVNAEMIVGTWNQFLWEEWDDDIQDTVSWSLSITMEAYETIVYEYANNYYGVIASGTYVLTNNTITAVFDQVSVYIDDYGHTGTIHNFTNHQDKTVHYEILSCTENELVVLEDIDNSVFHLERYETPGGGGNTISDPLVTTSQVTSITQVSALCGGVVVNDGGADLVEYGICWGTNSTPTINGNHCDATEGSGYENFSVNMTSLEPNTAYYVRAYATNSAGKTGYGNEESFFTLQIGGSTGSYNGHDYVDLGLPSGTLWATCNVGANTPDGFGDYFAWGEIAPKSVYDWSTYKYCNGSGTTLTKYCNNSSYGNNGFSDTLTVLLPGDDAATVNWGNGWCMPTYDQMAELYQYTSNTWITQNGVNGCLFTANNGNTLFLPAAGRRYDGLYEVGQVGNYWSSSLRIASGAWGFFFSSGGCTVSYRGRYLGLSVRAVRSVR